MTNKQIANNTARFIMEWERNMNYWQRPGHAYSVSLWRPCVDLNQAFQVMEAFSCTMQGHAMSVGWFVEVGKLFVQVEVITEDEEKSHTYEVKDLTHLPRVICTAALEHIGDR